MALRYTHVKHSNKQQLLKGYSFIPILTQWGEMDAFGHINNIWSFRYFEGIRIHQFNKVCEFLKASGHGDVAEGFMRAKGVGPILSATGCKYKRPGTFPDTLLVGVRVSDISADRLTHNYRIVSEKNDWLMSEGTADIVAFDYANSKKGEWSAPLRAALEKFNGSEE